MTILSLPPWAWPLGMLLLGFFLITYATSALEDADARYDPDESDEYPQDVLVRLGYPRMAMVGSLGGLLVLLGLSLGAVLVIGELLRWVLL